MDIKREDLLAAMTKVRPGLTDKEVVEQSDCFVFADGYIWTYNDDVCVSHPLPIVPATGKQLDLHGAVRAAELLSLVSRIKTEIIGVSTAGGELVITWKSGKASIRLEDEIKLPISEVHVPGDNDWTDLPKGFGEAMSSIVFCVSSDISRGVLTCCHVVDHCIEACDNFRLIRRKISSDLMPELLVPQNIAKVLHVFNPDAVCDGDTWLFFLNTPNDVLIACRKMGGKYPDLERLLPNESNCVCQFEFSEDIMDVLNRASIFAQQEMDQDEEISFLLTGKELVITTTNGRGTFEETASVKVVDGSTEEEAFSTNPSFIKDAIAALPESTVTLYSAGEDGARILSIGTDVSMYVIALNEEGADE